MEGVFLSSTYSYYYHIKCKPSLRTCVNHLSGLYTMPRALICDTFSVIVNEDPAGSMHPCHLSFLSNCPLHFVLFYLRGYSKKYTLSKLPWKGIITQLGATPREDESRHRKPSVQNRDRGTIVIRWFHVKTLSTSLITYQCPSDPFFCFAMNPSETNLNVDNAILNSCHQSTKTQIKLVDIAGPLDKKPFYYPRISHAIFRSFAFSWLSITRFTSFSLCVFLRFCGN